MRYTLIAEETDRSKPLSITQMCEAVSVSRTGYYRFQGSRGKVDPDLELRKQIEGITLEMPAYGYRRVTHELDRQGVRVNHKKVLRLMREDHLLCLRKRRFIRTTDSRHGLKVYPNLVKNLIVNDVNQLWVADITYIRLQREFVYLAVILDAFSRRCLGWLLGYTLEDELTLEALRMALSKRSIHPGLIHHSDRGGQYASTEYTDLLKEHGIRISMSSRGNPYDNPQAESFIKTVKYEEVYLFEYRDMAEAKSRIGNFIERVYNEKRLHSAIGYLPPAEFEQKYFQTPPA